MSTESNDTVWASEINDLLVLGGWVGVSAVKVRYKQPLEGGLEFQRPVDLKAGPNPWKILDFMVGTVGGWAVGRCPPHVWVEGCPSALVVVDGVIVIC